MCAPFVVEQPSAAVASRDDNEQPLRAVMFLIRNNCFLLRTYRNINDLQATMRGSDCCASRDGAFGLMLARCIEGSARRCYERTSAAGTR